MKAKSINLFSGLRQTSLLALVTTITAFASGNASAAQYKWVGTTNAIWATGTNWDANGVAPTNGSFTHRLNVNNTGANSIKPATYNFPGVTTTYAADVASASRGLVIGSGASNTTTGSMVISGGTFSTLGGIGADILGNGTGNTATLTIDGTSNSGDAQYVGTNLHTDMGLGYGSIATLNVKNGSATVAELRTNNTTATITLETGGTLAMNKLTYNGSGNNVINLDGGNLKARTATTAFIGTPTNGNTTINVKAGGAFIDTNGLSISIARPLLQDGFSTGGGITKNGIGTLTLGAVSTTTGAVTVNAGGLVVPVAATSWQPSAFTHAGSSLGFNLGVYNPSNLAPVSTGNVTFTSPLTVNITGSQFVVGQIPLIAYTGTLTGYTNLTLNTSALPAGVVATLEDDGAGLIFLNVTQGGFVWSGDSGTPGTGNWDTTSLNWNGFTSAYSNPAPVTFPNIIGGGTVTLTSDFAPASVEFTNTAGNDYLFDGTGKITGASAINKTGSGTVTLANTNDYSGNTTVANGTLTITSTAALPGWSANNRYSIASGATLAVQNTVSDSNIATMLATTGNFGAGAILGFDTGAADRIYAGNISGTIGVANVGPNVLTLSGTNSHTGNTMVSAGTLKAGSATAFTGTGPLVMSGFSTFDLGGHDARFTTINAGTISNRIADESSGTGTSTLSMTSGGASFVGIIADGSTRKVAIKCGAFNASNVPNNSDNTYSGGLTLLGAIAPATSGIRLIPYASFTTVDSETGLVTSGPYGTGPITVGEAATDKVQVYFQAAGRTIANNLIVNTAAGTDTAGTFRVESSGNTLSGAMIANQAGAFFRNNVTGGSAGNGAISLTGPISTGTNPVSGLTVNAAGVNTLAVTLDNQTPVANSYTGDTNILGANSSLLLAAAAQIPNGMNKGNVVMSLGKLDLAGFDETINGLSGSGTVDNLTTGTANTLTLGDGDATGTNFSGVIANTNGELALIKIGSGIQRLSGANTHTGPTTVKAGTLDLTGSTESTSVTVGGASAAGSPTLTGTGWVNGTLLVAAATGGAEGAINPGAVGTTGTLNVYDTTISGTYACDVISNITDVLSVNGNLDISGAKFALTQDTPTPGSYTIATYSGTLTGTFSPNPALPTGASLDYGTAGEIKLVLAPAGYDAWADINSVTEGSNGDDDKDGIINLVEYALGLDPKTGSPSPGSLVGNVIAFYKGSAAVSANDLTYAIETSSSLTPDSWTEVIPSTNDATKIEYTLPSGSGKLFGRLKVMR